LKLNTKPATRSAQLTPSFGVQNSRLTVAVSPVEADTEIEVTADSINKLSFRELQKECKKRELAAIGSTGTLRLRLLEFEGFCETGDAECPALNDDLVPEDFDFVDNSDPDFEFNSLNELILEKSSLGHWKAATRKLKQLKRRHATKERPVPRDTLLAVLEACMLDRLHGARASEPARKILEEMSDMGYEIPANLANKCIVNCLGNGPSGTHDGFGGIDPALAMVAAIQSSPGGENNIDEISYGAIVSALSKDGAIDEAALLLRAMVVDQCFTPPLSVFADVTIAASKERNHSETVLQVLSLAKAAGYELDTIGSAAAGRDVLASGVIAAEQIDNLALGLRLLTAAQKAEGCAPDRGDDLVAASSGAAQRACTLIHKKSIDRAVEDSNWKLAVKLLELMPQRSLTPSTSVWRKVVTVCAKNEKSRRATATLLDWVKMYEDGKAEKPPLSVFNTVINTCEICTEYELTVVVLEKMKEIHETDGNIITSNIALKRLAKLGASGACEGIIIGMLDAGMEPNVVTYTTAVAACATVGKKDPKTASLWLDRMRSRNVQPNFHTYNTALAACLDGTLGGTAIGSKICTDMVADIERELAVGLKGSADLKSVIPDIYTKTLCRSLMKQLRDNWRSGEIDMAVAKSTLRVPMLKLIDFNKSEAMEKAKAQIEEEKKTNEDADIETDETELEYSGVNFHKDEHRIAEV